MESRNEKNTVVFDAEAVGRVKDAMLSSQITEASANFCKAIADPTRMRMLYALSKHELCVGDLAAVLDMTKSAVSHQLRFLKEEGLVRSRRAGKNIYYLLDDEHVVEMLETTITHVRHKKGL